MKLVTILVDGTEEPYSRFLTEEQAQAYIKSEREWSGVTADRFEIIEYEVNETDRFKL